MIDRYVYDVIRRLPESQRVEVAKELRSDIDDMLVNKTGEEEIKAVLMTLGNPRIVANNYRSHTRYLISPEMIDDYYRVLKIVLIIVGSIGLVFGLMNHLMDHGATTFLGIFFEVLSETINDAISGLFRGFAIVTIVFAIIDQYRDKVKRPVWNVKDLPELPKENVAKISKTGSIVELILTVIGQAVFVYLLFNSDQYLVVYESWNDWPSMTPLITASIIQSFLPYCVGIAVFAITMQLLKVRNGYWSPSLALGHTMYQFLSMVLFVLFVRQSGLLHPEFVAEIAAFFEISANVVTSSFLEGITGFAIFICFVTTIDVISTWVKTLKHEPIVKSTVAQIKKR